MTPYTNPFASASETQLSAALSTPLPGGNEDSRSLLDADVPLRPPNAQRFSMLSPSIDMDTPRDSIFSENDSTRGISAAPAAVAGAATATEKEPLSGSGSKEVVVREAEPSSDARGKQAKKRRRLWWVLGAVGLLVVAAAVALPVGLIVGRRNKTSSSSAEGDGLNPAGTNNPPHVSVVSGGDGSTVTTEDGDTFTYTNPFGGFWYLDPTDPFNNNAQPNSWTPPLNTSWRYGIDKMYGVNLGGLFVLEPFITPALFEKYQNGSDTVIDEWTLSMAMAADTSDGGGLSQLEDHYNTFITEQDIAQIAGAGLNWIRLPIPFWAVDEWDEEPFLSRTCWKYILRVFRWARKYGLRINLDLHTVPGSQNGYNHSGRGLGQVNFMNGIMGYANAQRMLNYVRIITEFISQEEYKDLIPMFGIINEPRTLIIGKDIMTHFYLQAYDMIRNITGLGEGNGAYIGIHDGFEMPAAWEDFLPGSDRINMDWHPYFAFDGSPNTDPIDAWPPKACSAWGADMNNSQTAFGLTIAGEFSNAINDCGLFVNGIKNTHSYGGDCSFWEDSTQWNQTIVDGLKLFALASFDSLQNWFFWTWKIGNSSTTGRMSAPLWSYQAGLEGGWVPTDPRSAVGVCASLGVTATQFDGTYSAWQTGGSGAGTIEPTVRASFTAWPPTSISNVDNVAFVPTYTPTGTVSTLPPDSFTDAPKTLSVGDGWTDDEDTASAMTEVVGCSYPDAWDSAGVTLPLTTCTGSATAARFARRTPAPTALHFKRNELFLSP